MNYDYPSELDKARAKAQRIIEALRARGFIAYSTGTADNFTTDAPQSVISEIIEEVRPDAR